MSALQKTYVDYKNLGDTGTDSVSAIQPIADGEPASQNTFRRPSENLRSRTEIARSGLNDALYYRDRTQYLLGVAGAGELAWGGTIALAGTGVVDNTTQLTVRPLLTPQANIKGLLAVGTTLVNAVRYEVQATAYASDGMNAITVQHLDVTGTPAVTCTVSVGPVKRIVVVFDSANAGHNSTVTVAAVNGAIGGDTLLNGKLLAVDDGVPGSAILALAETAIDTKTHGVGTSGRASADLEEHMLPPGALGTFTGGRPLIEGDVLCIRYDYVVEPTGGDPNDPKGGVPGGRAESNAARGNNDVTSCLFVAQDNPEWLPGAIPLVKIVNNVARWVDGTGILAGSTAYPGSSIGTTIDPSGFQGVPTLTVGGGIDVAATSLQAAFDSVDDRLGQLRQATWTVTDGASSSGGNFNGAAALANAITASPGGGTLLVRRGTYAMPTGVVTFGNLAIVGERRDATILTCVGGTPDLTAMGRVHLKNLTLTRTLGGYQAYEEPILEDVSFPSSMLVLGGGDTNTYLARCKMTVVNQSAVNLDAGVVFQGYKITAIDCDFAGPDGLVVGGSVVRLSDTRQASFTRCRFIAGGTATAVAFQITAVAGVKRTITFDNCYFEGSSSTYVLDISNTSNDVEIVFNGCIFSNTTAAQVARLNPDGNTRVHLNDCQFIQNNTAVPTASHLIAAPAGSGRVVFTRCNLSIGQTNTGGAPTFSLVELGGSGGAATAGYVATNGLRIDYESTVTNLHGNKNLRFYQNTATVLGAPSNEFAGLTINFNGKAASVAIPGNSYVILFEGASAGRLLRVRGLALTGVEHPTVVGVNLLYTGYTSIDGLNHVMVSAPGGGTFSRVWYFEKSKVSRLEAPWVAGSTATLTVAGTTADRSMLADSHFSGTASGGGTFAQSIIKGVRFSAPCTFFCTNSAVEGCEFIATDGRNTILDATGTSANRITDNKFVIDSATANAVIDGIPTTTNGIIRDNQVFNLNAAVPTLGVPPASTLVGDNVLQGSVTIY